MASDHLQPATKLPCIRDLLFFVLQRCCITGAFSYGHSLGEVNPWILIPIETERHYIIDQKEKTPSSQKPWVPLHVDVLQRHHSQGPDHSFNHQQYFNILLHSLFDGHNIFPPKAPQRLPKVACSFHISFNRPCCSPMQWFIEGYRRRNSHVHTLDATMDLSTCYKCELYCIIRCYGNGYLYYLALISSIFSVSETNQLLKIADIGGGYPMYCMIAGQLNHSNLAALDAQQLGGVHSTPVLNRYQLLFNHYCINKFKYKHKFILYIYIYYIIYILNNYYNNFPS